jgi:hypothetical protein
VNIWTVYGERFGCSRPPSRFEGEDGKVDARLRNGWPEGLDEWDLVQHSPARELFPVPELVLFALRTIMGIHWAGVGEKVRWTVYATVDGEPVASSSPKFGFRILTRSEAQPKFLQRVAGQLSSSLRHLEPVLGQYADAQIVNERPTGTSLEFALMVLM